MVRVRQSSDYDKAKQWLERQGLAFPPIPIDLAPRMKKRGDWLFATRRIDMSPYDLREYVAELDGGDVDNYAILSHAGHGVNSYALHYYLVYESLNLLLQLGWGGVYMDEHAAKSHIQECFRLAGLIIESAVAKRVRVTIVCSDFYGCYWKVPGERGRNAATRDSPVDTLRDVLHWLQEDGAKDRLLAQAAP